MLLSQQQLRLFSAPIHLLPPFPFSHSLNSPLKSTKQCTRCSAPKISIAQLSEATTASSPPGEGPVEIPPSISPLFATDDDPTPLQTATSVLLTGAITIFLFRSLRRRAKRAKETKFRSSGEKKSLKEEALDSFKSVTLSPADSKSPPSPVQAFLGAVAAGVLALILYKFTTTIEASLNRQTIPDNYLCLWHDTAITFPEVIEQFESWLRVERNGGSRLWTEEGDGHLNGAAFVTCGNWDLKTKVPQQCEVSGMELPPYFMEWINLKDIYLNFYNRRAPGMLSMMRELRLKPLGSHHLGINDSKNIKELTVRLALSDFSFRIASCFSVMEMSFFKKFPW